LVSQGNERSGKPSQAIEVFYSETNLPTKYESISAAARTLKIAQSTIFNYISRNQQEPYKGR
jgi:hypothetical protein